MNMKKKVMSLALASTMVLGSASMAFAAPYDLVHTSNDAAKTYGFTEFVDSPSVFDAVAADSANYLIEAENGKLYRVDEVSAKTAEGKFFDEAIAELEPVEIETPVEGELEVVEVSAINANTISVTFNNEETVEFEVEEALEANVATEVTFEHNGQEFTVTVTWEVEEGLQVVEISAITKTYVDVTFSEIAEAMADVTIEVIDNNGNVVEVKAVNLVAGETTATFTFTKALTEDPEGVWNVGGVEVDLDLAANLKAVYGATTQVKLLEGLNKLGLTDVKAENIAHYEAELGKIKDTTKDTYIAEADFTLEDAQAIVTAGNEAALEAADETEVVKAVNEATTQVALLEALAPFERVNADWIADYDTALGTTETSIKGIQTKIDGANAAKVNPKVTALSLDAAGASIVKKDLNDAKALVTDYQKPDGAGENAKAEVLRKIDRQLAIVSVLEAETPAQLTVAINNLSAVDAAFELNMDNYKDANRAAYITALNGVGPFNTIALINTALSTVNTAQAGLPITAIKTATDADKLLAALKAYGDAKYVADDNKAFYWATGNANFSGVTTKATVQTAIDAANLAAVNQTTADANVTYKALVAYGNNIKDISVNNKTEYNTAFSGGTVATGAVQTTVDTANIAALQGQTTAAGVLAKLQIMTQVKNVKAENAKAYLTGIATLVTDISTVQSAVNAINTAEAAKVGVKAVNAATTAEELRDILTDLVVEGDITAASYLNLTNADKLLVAELFLDDDVFTANGLNAGVRTNLDADKEYQALGDIGTDLASLATKFDALRSSMNTVFTGNNVGTVTIASVQTQLAKLVKANYTAYDELTGTEKLAAAEEFIAAFSASEETGKYLAGYTTVNAYFAAVDAAIAK